MRKLLLLSVAFLLPTLVDAEPLRVFVSVLPLRTFVEKVGGEHVDVRTLVRPGSNPVTYDPTPKQIAALGEASLYVRTGVPFEYSWMERIRSANPRMQVLDAREGIQAARDRGACPRRKSQQGGEPGGALRSTGPARDGRGILESDPHVWTSPRLVKQMVHRIRDQTPRCGALGYLRPVLAEAPGPELTCRRPSPPVVCTRTAEGSS
jgi:zinc transport system substrate-binding protein